MATPSSILAWRIPWTEEPGRLQATRSQRIRYDWARTCAYIHTHTHTHTIQAPAIAQTHTHRHTDTHTTQAPAISHTHTHTHTHNPGTRISHTHTHTHDPGTSDITHTHTHTRPRHQQYLKLPGNSYRQPELRVTPVGPVPWYKI